MKQFTALNIGLIMLCFMWLHTLCRLCIVINMIMIWFQPYHSALRDTWAFPNGFLTGETFIVLQIKIWDQIWLHKNKKWSHMFYFYPLLLDRHFLLWCNPNIFIYCSISWLSKSTQMMSLTTVTVFLVLVTVMHLSLFIFWQQECEPRHTGKAGWLKAKLTRWEVNGLSVERHLEQVNKGQNTWGQTGNRQQSGWLYNHT